MTMPSAALCVESNCYVKSVAPVLTQAINDGTVGAFIREQVHAGPGDGRRPPHEVP